MKFEVEEAIKFAEQFVLDLFLSDYPELTYHQILTAMAEEEKWNEYITVWKPFANMRGAWLAETIDDIKSHLVVRLLNA